MKNITTPKAIVIAAAFLAIALFFAVSSSQVSSQLQGNGYMVAGDSSQFVWRVNTQTGQVSYCVRRDNSLDVSLLNKRPPYCSAESPPP